MAQDYASGLISGDAYLGGPAVGLLGGLAEGIKQGLVSYNDAKRMKMQEDQAAKEQALKERMLRAELFGKGAEEKDGQVVESELARRNALNKARSDAAAKGQTADYDEGGVLQFRPDPGLAEGLLKMKELDPFAILLKQAKLGEYQDKAQEKVFDKTPEGRLKKLSNESKARLDNARLALASTRDMANALLDKGSSTFSLIGDNPYTLASAKFEEAIGRMQSGGAIGEEEVKKFKALAPTFKDTPAIQQQKLAELEKEFADRIRTLGFQEQDLEGAGYSIPKLSPKAQKTLAPQVKQGLVNPKGPQISYDDLQAIEWAKANRKNPDAQAILKKNGIE